MIIAFAGRKQSGKSSAAEFIHTLYETSLKGSSKIFHFADPLKRLCIDILGLAYHQCYGNDHEKNELVDCYWQGKQLTAREVLQIVGTDMFRTMQHDVWAGATIRSINKHRKDLSIIADCRFPNEVEAIKKAGGIVIKLNRNLYKSTHASEKALDATEYNQSHFDLVVDNSDIELREKNELIYNFLLDQGIMP